MNKVDWKESIRSGPFRKEQSDEFIKWVSDLDHDQLQWVRGFFAAAGSSYLPAFERLALDTADEKKCALSILYGTQTGNSQKLAEEMAARSKALGIVTIVHNMVTFNVRDLKSIQNVAIIVSTQGMGEPPIEAADLHAYLHSAKARRLNHIRFAVLALGDTSYSQFCQTGRDFDTVLEKLGAQRLHPRKDCDVDYEDDGLSWMETVLAKIRVHDFVSDSKVHLASSEKVTKPTEYSRKNPFSATVLEKIHLNGRGSSKQTYHFELSLKGSGIRYLPGDSLGVYGVNALPLIENLLTVSKLSGEDIVQSHSGEKTLLNALTTDYEITPLTALSLNRYAELTDSSVLRKIVSEPKETSDYLYGRDVIDLLKEFPFKMDARSLVSILRKNTARMYSIASSLANCEEEAHLLVSRVSYQSYNRLRNGLCSGHLTKYRDDNSVTKIFIESNPRFRLPVDGGAPIIMIGAGTGVAPYRAFMQQRDAEGASGKTWLFFGERNFTTDFYYQTEWQEYLRTGILTKCDVAFSRDTSAKIYIQDKVREKGKELFSWLEDGAHLYICGDANGMAKDVGKALKQIVSDNGGMSNEKAEEYLKYLQLSERFQMDVY